MDIDNKRTKKEILDFNNGAIKSALSEIALSFPNRDSQTLSKKRVIEKFCQPRSSELKIKLKTGESVTARIDFKFENPNFKHEYLRIGTLRLRIDAEKTIEVADRVYFLDSADDTSSNKNLTLKSDLHVDSDFSGLGIGQSFIESDFSFYEIIHNFLELVGVDFQNLVIKIIDDSKNNWTTRQMEKMGLSDAFVGNRTFKIIRELHHPRK